MKVVIAAVAMLCLSAPMVALAAPEGPAPVLVNTWGAGRMTGFWGDLGYGFFKTVR